MRSGVGVEGVLTREGRGLRVVVEEAALFSTPPPPPPPPPPCHTRESATPQKVKEKHRILLMANHPDTGGSTFIAGKLNEAKELLLNENNAGSSAL